MGGAPRASAAMMSGRRLQVAAGPSPDGGKQPQTAGLVVSLHSELSVLRRSERSTCSSSRRFATLTMPRTAFLESFGRRRRTKVLEERTRGGQASVYGDLGSWLMQGAAERWRRRVRQRAALRCRCAVCWVCALRWTPTASVWASATRSSATLADRRCEVAAALGWSGPCRVTETPPRLSVTREAAHGAGTNGRKFR